MPAVNVIELHKGAIEPGINNPINPRTIKNFLRASEELTGAYWGNVNSSDTDTVLTADVGTHASYIANTGDSGATAGDQYTISCVASPGTHDDLWIGDRGNLPSSRSATFALDTGTVVGHEGIAARMELLPDGSYLCTLSYIRDNTGTASCSAGFGTAAHSTNIPSATYAGTETLNITKFQIQKDVNGRTTIDGYVYNATALGTRLTHVFGSTSTKLWKGAVSPAQVLDEAFVSLGTNVIKLWKGAVEPAEKRPTGNEYQAWKGAVEPARVQIDGLTAGHSGLGRGGLGGSGLG